MSHALPEHRHAAQRTRLLIVAVVVALVGAAAAPWSAPPAVARVLDQDALGTKVIQTFAGTGEAGFSGDGGPATKAQLNRPYDAAVDSNGNVYIPEQRNHRVRKVAPSGTITTVAGTGDAGFNGDQRQATDAQLFFPVGVAVDSNDNLYIADGANHRVRKVDTSSGVITTVAGTGNAGFSGDGGPASEAQLNFPFRVAVDDEAGLYIADAANHRIRRVDDTSRTITTVAGTGSGGFSGDGGPATEAQLNLPFGVDVDDTGNVYVADWLNNRVRRVDASGVITTVAGTGGDGFSGDGGPASDAQLGRPTDVAVDEEGSLYIADRDNARVRWVNSSGMIATVAGGGDPEDGVGDGLPPTEARLLRPEGVTTDQDLGLLIADWGQQRARQVTRVPDLVAVNKTRSANPATVGEPLDYTLEVSNPGLAGTASGVVLTDPLPEGMAFESVSAPQGSCSEANGTVSCELGELAEGETVPVTVTVTPTVPKIIDNTATVSTDGDDPHPRNNSASVTTVIADAGCGQVLTQDTTLSEDIGPCPRNGLIVGADAITVDLNGHEVIGWRGYEGFGFPEYIKQTQHPMEPGLEMLNNGDTAGVVVVNRHRVTVQNGAVTRFDAGVVLGGGSSKNTVQDMNLSDNNGPHPRSGGPLGDGVFVFNSPDNVIADNTLKRNGTFDGIGVWGPDSDGNQITGNTVEDNPHIGASTNFAHGIIVNGADMQQGTITGSTVSNNTVRGNAGHGISNVNHFDAKIVNNVIEGNGVGDNGGRGIGLTLGRDLKDSVTDVRIVGNQVHDNLLDGIHIGGHGNTIINNTATNNAREDGGSHAGQGLFDLKDLNEDCDDNTWNNNKWGSAGYHPECTSTRGLGSGNNPAANADPEPAEDAEPLRRGPPPQAQNSE